MTVLEYIKYIDYNYVRGYAYEQYCVANLHKFYDIEEIYLWKNVPYQLFVEASIIIDYERDKNYRMTRFKFLMDTGIDLVAKLKNNDILLVQCKCYQHRCISQKNLGGFYRMLLDTLMYNKNNKKKTNVIGLIAHSNCLSDIITASYSYKQGIVQDVYIPFEQDPNTQTFIQNKLKRYKDIVCMMNLAIMIVNICCLLWLFSEKRKK
jgi:predicted helicase